MKADKQKSTYEIHPAAELLPLLDGLELEELVADIRANGLREPILLDEQNRVVDGRNRLRACEMAGVEPRFKIVEDEDVPALVMSLNLWRRHLTPGQKAVVAARLWREDCAKWLRSNGEQTSVGATVKGAAKALQVAARSIQRAAFVLDYAADLAEEVLLGTKTLGEAEREARLRRNAVEGEEATKELLRCEAPDLWELVDAGRIDTVTALTQFDRRNQQERERLRSLSANLNAVLTHLDPFRSSVEERACTLMDARAELVPCECSFDVERVRRCAAVLNWYLKLREEEALDDE